MTLVFASAPSATPRQNKLLATLPASDYARVEGHLDRVTLPAGAVLYEYGSILTYMLFPADSIVSLLCVMENGASAEVAAAGNDGLIGISLYMGGMRTSSRAVVRSEGSAFRLTAGVVQREFHHGGPFQALLLGYAHTLITQMAQTAVCNQHHTVEQRLCRWLLTTLDQRSSNELTVTQELIAGMLGVRREGVTEAARRLQAAGVIRNRRGHITVLDRVSLEQRVCECYFALRREADRLTRPAPFMAARSRESCVRSS